jgi:cytosine/adenosine deaminase-related metal-dependent hydrolase
MRSGCAEMSAAGTTLVGDIVSSDWKIENLPAERPRMVAFLELLGLAPDRAAPQLDVARRFLEGDFATDAEVIAGLSPHAPYSVHPELFRGLVDLAEEQQAPLAMHLAETEAELQLLATGSGPFVEFLTTLGVWRSDVIPQGARPLDYLRPMARLARALVIHGNFLAADEIEFLSQSPTISVVYCPRTHAYFGHAPHPWQTMLECGVNVALGTDSRASNPDLSLWGEVRHLHAAFPGVSPALLLELATRCGARALGCEEQSGTLTPGKRAELTLVQLESPDATDPWESLLAPRSRAIAPDARLQHLLGRPG